MVYGKHYSVNAAKMLTAWLLLLLLGLVVGFFAGLFGIGGGAIMVPALTAYFIWQDYEPDKVVHMALATSLSVIMFNALISIRTHHRHQAVLWPLVMHLAPAVIVGSMVASWWALQIEGRTVAMIFMVLMSLIAIQLATDFKPQHSDNKPLKRALLWPAGVIIGWFSALIAIGGGSLTVPFLSWHRVDIKQAIGTAAAVGFFIAVAGSLTYIVTAAFEVSGSGYIYWPATTMIVMGSVFSTQLGANLTHRLPTKQLQRGFAVLIILLAVRMYLTLS